MVSFSSRVLGEQNESWIGSKYNFLNVQGRSIFEFLGDDSIPDYSRLSTLVCLMGMFNVNELSMLCLTENKL